MASSSRISCHFSLKRITLSCLAMSNSPLMFDVLFALGIAPIAPTPTPNPPALQTGETHGAWIQYTPNSALTFMLHKSRKYDDAFPQSCAGIFYPTRNAVSVWVARRGHLRNEGMKTHSLCGGNSLWGLIEHHL